MTERKLDKKYRPKIFSHVLGQAGTVKVLQSTLKDVENEVTPTIFYGSYGSGKTTLGRIYARAILCPNRDENFSPCNVCDSCIAFLNDSHMGYLEIDGANLTKVDDFRAVLESTEYTVAGSAYRVYLIDECHMMSKSAQNLFLKPLEEGIKGVFWIFCTTEYEKIIPTIQSRCVNFAIRPIDTSDIVDRMVEVCTSEDIPFELEALKALVAAKKGHVRDILVFIGQVRNLGGIVESVVYDYLDIGVNDSYFKILTLLQTDLEKSMNLLTSALSRVSAQDAYNGLSVAAMDAYKSSCGVPPTLVLRDSSLCEELYTTYGSSVSELGRYMIQVGNRRVDGNFLRTTLLLMRERLVQDQPLNQVALVAPRVVQTAPRVVQTAPRVVQPSIAVEQKTSPQPKPTKAVEPKPVNPPISERQVLTDLDDKARRKRKVKAVDPVEAKRVLDQGEHAVLSESMFALRFQRGFST